MKRLFILLSILVMVIGLAVSAQATLVDMHDGTIYDTDTQLSWLQNANTAGTTMTWSQANAWAASLNSGSGFAGLTGWRLPTTTQPDASCGSQYDPDGAGGIPSQGYGYNCSLSEMARLFYISLGNKGYCDASGNCPQAGYGLTNTGPFTNMQDLYWSGTEYAPNPADAWPFDFFYGSQNYNYKDDSFYAWAVRPGARSTSGPATPVPASGTVGLIIMGLAGLIIVGTKLKKVTR